MQLRSARSRTVTSLTGPARALFLRSPARDVSLQGALSVVHLRRGLMLVARARGPVTSRMTAKFAISATGLARVLFLRQLLPLFPHVRAEETLPGVRDVALTLVPVLHARNSRRDLLQSALLLLLSRTTSGARRCALSPLPARRRLLPLLLRLLRHPRSARG